LSFDRSAIALGKGKRLIVHAGERAAKNPRKALGFLGNYFAVFPNVKRCAVHSGCLLRILRRTAQGLSYSYGEAYLPA
jgi:hypothetical protein